MYPRLSRAVPVRVSGAPRDLDAPGGTVSGGTVSQYRARQRPITRSGETISIELHQPYSMPAAVRVVWPTAATITTPARYNEVASAAMQLLAEPPTMLARFKASNGCNGLAAWSRP
jgi:hypothetical protein